MRSDLLGVHLVPRAAKRGPVHHTNKSITISIARGVRQIRTKPALSQATTMAMHIHTLTFEYD